MPCLCVTGRRLLLGLLLATAAAGIAWLALPPLTAALLKHALARAGLPDCALRVRRITPWRLELADLRLGRGPDAPRCDRLTATFSPTLLKRRRLESLRLDGVRLQLRLRLRPGTAASGLEIAGVPPALLAKRRKAAGGPAATPPPPGLAQLLPLESLQIRDAAGTLELPDGSLRLLRTAAATLAVTPAGLAFAGDVRAGEAALTLRGTLRDGAEPGTARLASTLALAAPLPPPLRPILRLPDGLPPLTLAGNLRWWPDAQAAITAELPDTAVALASLPAAGSGAFRLAGTAAAEWRAGEAAALQARVRLREGQVTLPGRATVEGISLDLAGHWRGGSAGGAELDSFAGGWQGATAFGLPLAAGEIQGEPLPAGIRLRTRLQPAASALAAEVTAMLGWQPLAAKLDLRLPPARLTATDPALRRLLPPGESLELSGEAAAAAALRWTPGRPLAGQAKLTLRDGRLALPGKQLTVEGINAAVALPELPALRSGPGQSLSFTRAEFAGIGGDGGRILFRIEGPDSLYLERAELRFGPGRAYLYAVPLPKLRPEGPIEVHLAKLDVGWLLRAFRGVEATGSGTLNGRLAFELHGPKIKIGGGYLYTEPGQTGSFQLRQDGWIAAALGRAGPNSRGLAQVRAALKDFNYSVFRLDLEPETDQSFLLRWRLAGEARADKRLPPVDLTINFRAPLQELFDIGRHLAPFLF